MTLSQAKGQKAIVQHRLKRTTFCKATKAPKKNIELLDEKEVGKLTSLGELSLEMNSKLTKMVM